MVELSLPKWLVVLDPPDSVDSWTEIEFVHSERGTGGRGRVDEGDADEDPLQLQEHEEIRIGTSTINTPHLHLGEDNKHA